MRLREAGAHQRAALRVVGLLVILVLLWLAVRRSDWVAGVFALALAALLFNGWQEERRHK